MHAILFLEVALAVAQVEVDVGTGVGSVVGNAVGAFATTLVVGVILVAIAPGYLEARVDELEANPLSAFLVGFAVLLGLLVSIVLLFFTLVGIPAAILLGIVAYLLWAVGATVGYVAIALRIVDRGAAAEAGGAEAEVDDWLVPILVAAGLNGALALTGIGALVSVVVGAAGFGVVITELTD